MIESKRDRDGADDPARGDADPPAVSGVSAAASRGGSERAPEKTAPNDVWPCVGSAGHSARSTTASSRKAKALRAALHAAVDAFCSVMEAADRPDQRSVRVVRTATHDVPDPQTLEEAQRALRRIGRR